MYRQRLKLSPSPTLALTFDDGPDPETTPALIDLLAQHGIVASFFLLGSKLQKHPGIAESLLKAGHLLGNHSYSHAWRIAVSKATLREEIQTTQKIFRDKLGISPRFFRPPRGLLAPWLAKEVQIMGMETIYWSLMPGDYYFWHRHARIERRVRQKVRPGDILVLHDGLNLTERNQRQHTMKALKSLLPWLIGKGYQFARLDRGLQQEAYQSCETL